MTPAHRDVHPSLDLLRTGGVVAGAVAASLTDSWADGSAEQVAWATLVVVALGSAGLWGWGRGSRSDGDLSRIGIVAFALDVALVCGLVWAFADRPFVFTLVPVVAISGGLRYRWVGAWLGSVLGIALCIAALAKVADLSGTTFDRSAFLTIAATTAALGSLAAAVAAEWRRRTIEYENQAARLNELGHIKDRYIAMTSHEIRGPVSTMITAVDTVRSRWDKMDEERRDHLLEMVYMQGRELDRLVEDLFISAEKQGGGVSVQPEWVDVEPTITRAVEAATARRRGHLLEIFVDPMRAEIDPYRVTQIVRNLVENAYKYTADRTRVVVSARGVAGGIQLEVRDDGEGIPDDKRDKLFEAFTRIEETAAGQEGVGLGLFVVSQLVAAMNGSIDLHSSSRGTTFSINIPCPTESNERPRIGLVGDDEATLG